jgi:hypothetical protein
VIDRRIQMLLLLNTGCCASCQSQTIDDICAALESGDVTIHYTDDVAVGIFATRDGIDLMRTYSLLPTTSA